MSDKNIIQLRPGQGKPLELQELEQQTEAEVAVSMFMDAVEAIANLPASDLARVSVSQHGFAMSFSVVVRRSTSRLAMKQIEVHNYVNPRRPV